METLPPDEGATPGHTAPVVAVGGQGRRQREEGDGGGGGWWVGAGLGMVILSVGVDIRCISDLMGVNVGVIFYPWVRFAPAL
jgi:hypothetical protein